MIEFQKLDQILSNIYWNQNEILKKRKKVVK